MNVIQYGYHHHHHHPSHPHPLVLQVFAFNPFSLFSSLMCLVFSTCYNVAVPTTFPQTSKYSVTPLPSAFANQMQLLPFHFSLAKIFQAWKRCVDWNKSTKVESNHNEFDHLMPSLFWFQPQRPNRKEQISWLVLSLSCFVSLLHATC